MNQPHLFFSEASKRLEINFERWFVFARFFVFRVTCMVLITPLFTADAGENFSSFVTAKALSFLR